MAYQILQSAAKAAWALARKQHWVITRQQLLALGFSHQAIVHRLRKGRLHRTEWRGVYAVGRKELTREGRWMAAVLACGEGAALAGHTAAQHCRLLPHQPRRRIEVLIPPKTYRTPKGIRARRGTRRIALRDGIPTTSVVDTLVDIAASLTPDEREAAIGEADRLGLIHVPDLRAALDGVEARPGVGILKRTIDRRSYVMTHSHTERRFVPIALRAGMPKPRSQRHVGSHRVDFFFDTLGMVVEVDGITYHRTPAQQAEDRVRDQDYAAAGLTPLRFTHAQVRWEPERVERILRAVAEQVRSRER
jgi:very-short-patch-repair endonuclease